MLPSINVSVFTLKQQEEPMGGVRVESVQEPEFEFWGKCPRMFDQGKRNLAQVSGEFELSE